MESHDRESEHLPANQISAHDVPPPHEPLVFGTMFSRLFGGERQDRSMRRVGPPASLSRPLEALGLELREMLNRADAGLRESQATKLPGGGIRPGGVAEKEQLLEEREQARHALESDIAHLHGQLGTGIDEDQEERLRRLLGAHSKESDGPSPATIEDRIERAVLHQLYLRAREEAWHRLEDLVEQSGLVWPVQQGLSETLAVEELDRLRERHRKEIHTAFLAASARQTSDLIQGEVQAWRYSYPNRHSYLWLQAALLGVAAALTAQFFAAALELWMWRTAELERELLKAVDDELKGPRLSLRTGIQSFSEAVEIGLQVEKVCETVIPDLIWSFVAPRLEWVRTGEAAPPISVLATGLSKLDPVCGMALTSERVATRLDHQGRLFYFCSPFCRRFFEASPSRFLSDQNGRAHERP